eukprot:m51a1_g13165 hypothetical protein (397) ;mRNA; r:69677-70867
MMWSKINRSLVEEKRSYAPAKPSSHPAAAAAAPGPSIDCSAGSSPYQTSELVFAGLPSGVSYDWVVKYPHYAGLADAIRAWWRPFAELSDDNVLVTAGSIEALSLTSMLFLRPGARALGYAPQFLEFENYTKIMGIEYRAVPLRPEARLAFSTDELVAAIAEEDSVVYVDNPNNPTGQVIPLADIRRIVEAARAKGVCVLVDEAYGEYMSESNSAALLVGEYDNVIVARTFSKGWGLAGVRAGYVLACARLTALLAKLTNPYVVPELARRVVAYALTSDPAFPSRCRERVVGEKRKVVALCRNDLSVSATDDSVPILLITHRDPACDLQAMFSSLGIDVISAGCFRGLGNNSVRLRLPEPASLEGVLRVLQEIDCGCKNVRNQAEGAAVSSERATD